MKRNRMRALSAAVASSLLVLLATACSRTPETGAGTAPAKGGTQSKAPAGGDAAPGAASSGDPSGASAGLGASDAGARVQAARALASRRDPEAVTALMDAISRETDPAAAVAIVEALVAQGDARAAESIDAYLARNPQPPVALVTALGSFGGDDRIRRILGRLESQSTDPAIQGAASAALQQAGDRTGAGR